MEFRITEQFRWVIVVKSLAEYKEQYNMYRNNMISEEISG